MALYSWLYRHLIRYSDPESAHHLGISAISLAGRCPVSRRVLRATVGYIPPIAPTVSLAARKAGVTHIGPRVVPARLGLAAGMDKDAEAILGMSALGFGFVEVGTITPKPQPGNDAPRLWRLIDEGGLRNRMGFNNLGVDHAVEEFRALRSTKQGRSIIVGANIGKNKTTSAADAARDYEICASKVAPWVDFVVVNVSSPNTPGLRDLQSVGSLRDILAAARRGCDASVKRRMPLLVKIAPDLSNEDIVDIVALTKELGLEGVVATNTTIDHDLGEGGVSGAPLFPRAYEVVSVVAEHLDDSQILIATGGITTIDDARLMIDAGADLVEGFTAFVSQGPLWPGEVNRALRTW